MKTLYRITALVILAPFVAGAVMFVAAIVSLFALIGALYDATSGKSQAERAQ